MNLDIEKTNPLHSFVLLKRMPPELRLKITALALPDTLYHDSDECEVLKVGPGRLFETGQREPMNIKEGDRVIVYQNMGTELGGEYFMADISEIEAIVHRG